MLLAPSIIFLFGIVPVIFLAFGILIRRKSQDFSSIDTAVTNFKGYYWLMLIGCIIFLILQTYIGYTSYSTLGYFPRWGPLFGPGRDHQPNLVYFLSHWEYWATDESFGIPFFFLPIAFTYLIAVNTLFYRPSKKHSEWIAVNGFFATKPKSGASDGAESEVDIIKAEKLKQYSVADELLKWAKLKEDGHISEEEFNEAKDKLLKRN